MLAPVSSIACSAVGHFSSTRPKFSSTASRPAITGSLLRHSRSIARPVSTRGLGCDTLVVTVEGTTSRLMGSPFGSWPVFSLTGGAGRAVEGGVRQHHANGGLFGRRNGCGERAMGALPSVFGFLGNQNAAPRAGRLYLRRRVASLSPLKVGRAADAVGGAKFADRFASADDRRARAVGHRMIGAPVDLSKPRCIPIGSIGQRGGFPRCPQLSLVTFGDGILAYAPLST